MAVILCLPVAVALIAGVCLWIVHVSHRDGLWKPPPDPVRPTRNDTGQSPDDRREPTR